MIILAVVACIGYIIYLCEWFNPRLGLPRQALVRTTSPDADPHYVIFRRLTRQVHVVRLSLFPGVWLVSHGPPRCRMGIQQF